MQVLAGVLVGSVGFVTIMSIIPSFIRDLDNRVRSIYYEEIVSPYYKWIQSKDKVIRGERLEKEKDDQLIEYRKNQEQNRNDPFGKSNIVKVLNRVRCNKGSHECVLYASDEMLRNQCFLNGYVTSIMNQQVQSSRDIVELIPINIPHFRGESVYCIGSEYITK